MCALGQLPGYVFMFVYVLVGIHVLSLLCLSIFSSLFVQDGRTPLFIAAQEGHREVCAALIAAKASVDTADEVIIGVIFLVML